MQDPLIGKTVGRYRIEAEISRGGMGVVYRGRQLSLNRSVAIKALPPQFAVDEEFVHRFRQEAESIAGLAHENIVHVYDIEEAYGTWFIMMEYVEGVDLRTALRSRPPGPDEIRRIGIAVARALHAAHQRGIVHRDVKGHNVMITADGSVKLMDFGLARVAGSGVKTQTGTVMGTPEYMAPEQAQSGEISPRTDLYSLGVVLFELATGRVPFAEGDAFAIALKHITQEPPLPRSLNPDIPPWLEEIIIKSMAKKPEDRYQSAAELERALSQRTSTPSAAPHAPPPLAGERSPSQDSDAYTSPGGGSSPTRWAWAAVVAAVIFLGAVVIITGARWLRSERPLPEELGAFPAAPSDSALPQDSQFPSHQPGSSGDSGNLIAEELEGDDLEIEPPVPLTEILTVETPAQRSTLARPPASTPPSATRPSQALKAEPVPQTALPEDPPARVDSAEPPPPAPPIRYDEEYECSEGVEFHVDPEEALVTVNGQVLGIADDWDDRGGGQEWQPGPGIYSVKVEASGLPTGWAKIIIRPDARNETCKVDLELEDL